MRGFCLFGGTGAANNEAFRKQLQMKNKYMWGVILLSILTVGVAWYIEFSEKIKVDDYMLGVYCGLGVALFAAGVISLIRNKRLLKDEAKLKEARLQMTDERNMEISSCALRITSAVLLIVMYLLFIIGGLFNPMISKLMSVLICLFAVVYCIVWRVLNNRM